MTAQPDVTQPTLTELFRRWQEGGNAPGIGGLQARARLVVWAGEVNGRSSEETRAFLSLLAKAKARSENPVMRRRGGGGERDTLSLPLCSATNLHDLTDSFRSLVAKSLPNSLPTSDGGQPPLHKDAGLQLQSNLGAEKNKQVAETP